jgi:hypothetical protein
MYALLALVVALVVTVIAYPPTSLVMTLFPFLHIPPPLQMYALLALVVAMCPSVRIC